MGSRWRRNDWLLSQLRLLSRSLGVDGASWEEPSLLCATHFVLRLIKHVIIPVPIFGHRAIRDRSARGHSSNMSGVAVLSFHRLHDVVV